MHDVTLPEQVAALVERDYDVGRVRSAAALSGGMFQRPVCLQTDRGAFVYRLHTFRASEQRFRFQAEVLEYAAAHGVACPRVVRDRSGAWGRAVGDAVGALHEYAEGRVIPWPEWCTAKTEGTLEHLGAQVASVHSVLARARPDGDTSLPMTLPPIQFDCLPAIRDTWRSNVERLRTGTAGAASPAARSELVRLAAAIEAHWDHLEGEVRRLDVCSWPRQVVHGDVSPVNMVWLAEGGGFALIDWDCTHLGWRMYDALGDVLLRAPWDHADLHRARRQEAQAYVRGYAAAADPPLTDAERRAVPAFVVARQLEDLRQRVAVLDGLEPSRDGEYAALVRMRVRMMDDVTTWERTGDL